MENRVGQSMIEAIVAVAIIGIALVGFLSQSTYNYLAVSESFTRNIASNLAREGVEVVRNMRDTNWLKGCPNPEKPAECFVWNSGFSHNMEYSAVAILDVDAHQWSLSFVNKAFDACVADETCRLYKNQSGIHTASPVNAEPSIYYRQLELRPICADETACGGDGVCQSGEKCPGAQIGVEVAARVGWKKGADWRSEMAVERLYNWK